MAPVVSLRGSHDLLVGLGKDSAALEAFKSRCEEWTVLLKQVGVELIYGNDDDNPLLGNETRARVLHALARAGELCVSDLAEAVAMKPQAISNQLQRLADRRVVATRRQGTTIYYRIVNPCVAEIFERALCLLEDARSGVHTGGA